MPMGTQVYLTLPLAATQQLAERFGIPWVSYQDQSLDEYTDKVLGPLCDKLDSLLLKIHEKLLREHYTVNKLPEYPDFSFLEGIAGVEDFEDQIDQKYEMDYLVETVGLEEMLDAPFFEVDTPWGPRQVAPFHFSIVGDDNDTDGPGDVWPEDFKIGVPLATRYYPTWLDISSECGHGSTSFSLNVETQKLLEIAQQAISQEIPEFSKAVCEARLEFF